jgi:hypothetical protein
MEIALEYDLRRDLGRALSRGELIMSLLTMTGFTRAAFEAAGTEERDALCARLAAELSSTLAGERRFHDAVAAAVAELREGGHDLWSYDENDEFEVWGPNYVSPSGPGLLITFRASGPTEVSWSPHTAG